jgi:hypothetical protein
MKDTDPSVGLGKTCSKCGETKPLDRFTTNPNGRFGRHSRCRDCQSSQQKRARLDDPERMRGYSKRYKAANPDKVKAASKSHYERTKRRQAKRRRERYQNNKEFELARNRRWAEANQERVREIGRRAGARQRSTPRGRLENAISAGVHRGLRRGAKASRRTFDILGYSLNQLMRHLEKRFQPGMSWENYGKWHVDHKIPLSAHNYEAPDDTDFKKAWALKNLQPLWGPDNINKHAKLDKEFQPSLAFGVSANDNNKGD